MIGGYWNRFTAFLRQDSWQAWVVSLLLMFIFVKFIFFPILSFAFDTSLPLVVVESCSMYHEDSFAHWWERNGLWYQERDISQKVFSAYPFKGGLSKGDVILVSGRGDYQEGDVIIFNANYQYPLIHRVISKDPLATKGDHNGDQLDAERNIDSDQVVGKAVARIPALGWLKLVFFELFKDQSERGFCK